MKCTILTTACNKQAKIEVVPYLGHQQYFNIQTVVCLQCCRAKLITGIINGISL